MIRAAIIGVGYWGPNILRNFYEHPDITVKWACDMSAHRLQSIRFRYPDISLTRHMDDVVNDPSVDLVAVVTPVKTHHEIAMRALRAGKHVLITKPMANTQAECFELIEEAKRQNKILMVDHTFVYHPAVSSISQMISNNVLGDLLYYHSSRMNLGLYQPDVSVIYDLIPHDVSILNEWIKGDPSELSVTAKHAAALPQPDIAFIQMNYDNNFIASIHASWLSPSKIRETTLTGRQKMVVYNDIDVVQPIKLFDKGVESLAKESRESSYTTFIAYRHGDVYSPAIPQTEALKVEVEHLVDCIEHNKIPRTDGYQGLRVVRLLEYADRLARGNKCWVKIPQMDLPKSLTPIAIAAEPPALVA